MRDGQENLKVRETSLTEILSSSREITKYDSNIDLTLLSQLRYLGGCIPDHFQEFRDLLLCMGSIGMLIPSLHSLPTL